MRDHAICFDQVLQSRTDSAESHLAMDMAREDMAREDMPEPPELTEVSVGMYHRNHSDEHGEIGSTDWFNRLDTDNASINRFIVDVQAFVQRMINCREWIQYVTGVMYLHRESTE